jgi:hypothetical protein
METATNTAPFGLIIQVKTQIMRMTGIETRTSSAPTSLKSSSNVKGKVFNILYETPHHEDVSRSGARTSEVNSWL